jgi:tRNA-2-methylthio-N6-dimethylallyladenosine synthase
MAKYENICKCIHLPIQSGNSRILEKMNRTYTREWYFNKVDRIRALVPECSITSDLIAGFCSETEEDHQDTLTAMQYSNFDFSYMYYYSERPGTLAERKYDDDIPEDVKKRRLDEIIQVQNKLSKASNQKDLGKVYKVLIEGESKKNINDWKGRNSQNKVLVFAKGNYNYKAGQYVYVKVNAATQGTLLGEIVEN